MDLISIAILERAPELLLHTVRVGAFLTIAPMFSQLRESRLARTVLAIALGIIFFWSSPGMDHRVVSLGDLAAIVFREALIGVLAGFSLRAISAMLMTAGEILSHEMGFSMARIMNPETGSAATPMAMLFESAAFLMILDLNLHHDFLRVIQQSYEFIPVGESFTFAPAFEQLGIMVTSSITLGLRYAMPIYGVLILLTVTLMILARAVQNINLMEFSFALRILLALSSSVYFLREGAPFLAEAIRSMIDRSFLLFAGS